TKGAILADNAGAQIGFKARRPPGFAIRIKPDPSFGVAGFDLFRQVARLRQKINSVLRHGRFSLLSVDSTRPRSSSKEVGFAKPHYEGLAWRIHHAIEGFFVTTVVYIWTYPYCGNRELPCA